MLIDELFDKCTRDLLWVAKKMRAVLTSATSSPETKSARSGTDMAIGVDKSLLLSCDLNAARMPLNLSLSTNAPLGYCRTAPAMSVLESEFSITAKRRAAEQRLTSTSRGSTSRSQQNWLKRK